MQPVENPSRAGKRRFLLGSLVGGALVALAGTALVFAHAPGAMHGAHGGGMHFDEISGHLRGHVEHVLKEVKATPEQQAQVRSILEAASADVKALREQHGSAHASLHEIFVAPAIDRGRLEALRAEHIQALDAASKRCATALADAAEVLTPEQRAQLGGKMNH
jgi:Spy/CpxP family protein refolding chaperone